MLVRVTTFPVRHHLPSPPQEVILMPATSWCIPGKNSISVHRARPRRTMAATLSYVRSDYKSQSYISTAVGHSFGRSHLRRVSSDDNSNNGFQSHTSRYPG